jgi:hypothetical protein
MVTDHGTDARVTLDDGTVIGERDIAVRAKPNQPDRLRRLQQALEAVLAEAGCRGEILDRDRPAGKRRRSGRSAMRQTESGFARNR